MRPLPQSARIEVPSAVAADLLRAAESLPHYENQDFYSFARQAEVHAAIRDSVPGSWSEVVGPIRERLARRPRCALVSGLRFDEGNRLFVALNRELGDLVARPYQKPRAQLVHYIQPATDIAANVGQGFESERLHTDAADWHEPVRWLSMVCIRPDRNGGGVSRFLELEALVEEAAERMDGALLASLESCPVPWQVAPYLGGGMVWDPVLGNGRLRWRRYTVDAAVRENGLELDAPLVAALDAFGEVVESAASEVHFFMQANEFLLMDNQRALHARTPLAAGEEALDRLMIRSWVSHGLQDPGPAV
ncbi:MAG TPA: TauD/TfdA family dioxygenase [Thermoanaerobaculia bacterium]|nr:TauD/TfdA family dioxygenase [Thermoanaerobaculia bacterium]